MTTCRNKIEKRPIPLDAKLPDAEVSAWGRDASHSAPIRLLRLKQVMEMTGLGRTKIYTLQAEGKFPMRVQITPSCVAWVDQEIQTWIAERVTARASVTAISKRRTLQPSLRRTMGS